MTERQSARMSEIKNGTLGLYGAEDSNCNHMMTLGFKGKIIFQMWNRHIIDTTVQLVKCEETESLVRAWTDNSNEVVHRQTNINKLQSVQNSVARVVLKDRLDSQVANSYMNCTGCLLVWSKPPYLLLVSQTIYIYYWSIIHLITPYAELTSILSNHSFPLNLARDVIVT